MTQKHPSMIALLSGHADFGTKSHSYVHLFPWLVAAFLDCSEEMKPDKKLVERASQTPHGTLRGWMNRGGLHFIPLQLLKKNPSIKIEKAAITSACQRRSKTMPVGRSKSRPVVGSQVVEYSGAKGLWSVAEEALRP